MTTEDAFNVLLDRNPSDWQTRLIFADWLADRDDERQWGYRSLGQLQVYPYTGKIEDEEGWPFGREDNIHWASYRYHLLPLCWYLCIQPTTGFGKHWPSNTIHNRWADYPTRQLAEETVVAAFLKMSARDKERILSRNLQLA